MKQQARKPHEHRRPLGRRPLGNTDLILPEITDDGPTPGPCAVCNAKPADVHEGRVHEFLYPTGTKGMSVDNDLCLECAVHLWRAIKARFGDRTSVRQFALDLLEGHPVTATAVREYRSLQ